MYCNEKGKQENKDKKIQKQEKKCEIREKEISTTLDIASQKYALEDKERKRHKQITRRLVQTQKQTEEYTLETIKTDSHSYKNSYLGIEVLIKHAHILIEAHRDRYFIKTH